MKITVLNAARAVCLALVIAAAHAPPSNANPMSGESESTAQQAAPGSRLNLTLLEHRVRETRAISVLQKLALQQDVDDLIARIRAAHRARAELAALRRPYDKLLTNIQAMLRHDPQLADEIAASREAIWEVLADRSKFASL
jgi:cellobiose phosphorylase